MERLEPFSKQIFSFFENVLLPAFFVGLKIIMDLRMVSDCSQSLLNGINNYHVQRFSRTCAQKECIS